MRTSRSRATSRQLWSWSHSRSESTEEAHGLKLWSLHHGTGGRRGEHPYPLVSSEGPASRLAEGWWQDPFAIAPVRAHADQEDSCEIEARKRFRNWRFSRSTQAPWPPKHRSGLRWSRQAVGGFHGCKYAACPWNGCGLLTGTSSKTSRGEAEDHALLSTTRLPLPCSGMQAASKTTDFEQLPED
jgi:hypothetical protein